MTEIDRIVKRCTTYWRRTRVPRQAIAEMRTELESHLRAAVESGRPTASVIGDDVTAFAETWAREHRPPFVRPPACTGIGPALLAFLVGVPFFFFSFAIVTSSGSVTVECCPRRILEQSVESDPSGLFVFWLTIGIAVLAIAAGVLFLLRRFLWGSAPLLVAAPAAMAHPANLLPATLLAASLLWALWEVRRLARVQGVAATP